MGHSIENIAADYRRDGAAVIRNAIDAQWVRRMQNAVDRVITVPGPAAVEYTAPGKSGRFVGDFFVWMRDRDFEALAKESPLPMLAGQIMQATDVRLFYDQLLVKEPQTEEQTPWHQDLPYWPLRGADVLSMWVALDSVTLTTGAVRYARGSHRSGALYAPAAFGKDSGFGAIYARMGLPPFPAGDVVERDYEMLSWDIEPGDAVIHHPLVFHAAGGNLSAGSRRRAVSIRYMGDDVLLDGRPGTFIEKESVRALLKEPIAVNDGERPSGANFPIVWSRDGNGPKPM
jgi:ectoine hydroxylase-related dioxygenase (phytanoyl-CoA dioxygenase family)